MDKLRKRFTLFRSENKVIYDDIIKMTNDGMTFNTAMKALLMELKIRRELPNCNPAGTQNKPIGTQKLSVEEKPKGDPENILDIFGE